MNKVNHNYPEDTLKTLRLRENMDPTDNSRDEEFQTWDPGIVFDACLEWEGLINYDYKIHILIEQVYGLTLRPDDFIDNDQSKSDWIRGFGNIVRAMHNSSVEAMSMDDNEIVTISFKRSDNTAKANVSGDSFLACLLSIINQALI